MSVILWFTIAHVLTHTVLLRKSLKSSCLTHVLDMPCLVYSYISLWSFSVSLNFCVWVLTFVNGPQAQ